MLNRFRDLVKRLELPDDELDTVYRIIDNNYQTVEVTAAQYGNGGCETTRFRRPSLARTPSKTSGSVPDFDNAGKQEL